MEETPVQHDIKIRRRSSLFRSNTSSAAASPIVNNPSYEKQLTKEIDGWGKLIQTKFHEIKVLTQTRIELDESLLTDEQKQYLALGPNVDEFVRQSNEFSRLLERYTARKSFLMQRYNAILDEARAEMHVEALDMVEDKLVAQKIE